MEFLFKTNLYPILIDEWQFIPPIWDFLRNRIDQKNGDEKYILTGSSSFNSLKRKNKVFHSGIGRIVRLKMFTMSLYESKESSGKWSIMEMCDKKEKYVKNNEPLTLEELAKIIVRGGWPESLLKEWKDKPEMFANQYINTLITSDIPEMEYKNKKYFLMILRSIARNESTLVSYKTIIKDVFENEDEKEKEIDIKTLNSYLDIMRDLNIYIEDDAFDLNYRSSKKVGKSTKKHLVDPSLSCALLNLTHEKLLNDARTFGFMFEALVERDLRIYGYHLDATLYHFRDNSSGDEVDAILEFKDGSYCAFEIKLTWSSGVTEAIEHLVKFRNKASKKPKLSCVIVGVLDYVIYDKKMMFMWSLLMH